MTSKRKGKDDKKDNKNKEDKEDKPTLNVETLRDLAVPEEELDDVKGHLLIGGVRIGGVGGVRGIKYESEESCGSCGCACAVSQPQTSCVACSGQCSI